MKKRMFFLALGMVSLSLTVYAQTFGGGGYTGPSLEPVSIADVREAEASTFVIVTGTLIQQNVPGRFVLSEGEDDEKVSIIVHIDSYAWSNLEVDGETEVQIYGILVKTYSSTEIYAERVGLPSEE